jgi:MFS family permease
VIVKGGGGSRTFSSLKIRNFRLYFGGQLVSLAGTFMQTVAQSWLVLKLTGSGTALGLVTTLQYLPMLLLGPHAGVMIDRTDRRRLYMITQALSGAEALLLGVLAVTGTVQLWVVYLLAAVLGVITAFDQPLRSTFVLDMVGREDLPNAIGLNMALGNMSRVVGPALAGVTIATLGIGPCFLLNALSFAAVIAALLAMRPSEMHPVTLQIRQPGQVRAGLAYVRRTPELFAILLMSAVLFGLASEYEVILPLVARYTFHGGAGLYSLLTSMAGGGAVLAAFLAARQAKVSNRRILVSVVACGVVTALAAVAPFLWLEAGLLVLVGGTSTLFASMASATLQLRSDPAMRGRIMALWMITVFGTRPVGGLLVGIIAQQVGPRAAIGFGALAIFGIVLPLYRMLPERGPGDGPADVDRHPAAVPVGLVEPGGQPLAGRA